MKKLLLLGGLKYLIPVIGKAKNLGHYVITCDYLPDNPAHKYADEYHNLSILDRDAVLKLAESLQIDGIMSFAVDPGVLTAAYVSDKMGLPSSGPYESIEILQNKGLFRKFLEQNNFHVPKSKSFTDTQKALNEFELSVLPVIVKPVDSAGSKGVSKVEYIEQLKGAIDTAIANSPSKTFIIEQFLETNIHSSDTDCFSIDGEFKFVSFSSQRFDALAPNPFTPSAYSWPSDISQDNQNYLKSELQRLIGLLNMKTSIYNIEVRETVDGKAYIMEVSPRGGGNRLSEMLEYSTGTDLISGAINAALGQGTRSIGECTYSGNWAEIILYSHRAGNFDKIIVASELKKNIVEMDLWVQTGEWVNSFEGANHAIGTLVLRFETAMELEKVMSKYSNYIEVKVK